MAHDFDCGKGDVQRNETAGSSCPHLTVVVEDHHVSHAQISGAVHGLKSHAAGDGSVADHRNAVVPPLFSRRIIDRCGSGLRL